MKIRMYRKKFILHNIDKYKIFNNKKQFYSNLINNFTKKFYIL